MVRIWGGKNGNEWMSAFGDMLLSFLVTDRGYITLQGIKIFSFFHFQISISSH